MKATATATLHIVDDVTRRRKTTQSPLPACLLWLKLAQAIAGKEAETPAYGQAFHLRENTIVWRIWPTGSRLAALQQIERERRTSR